MLRHPGRGGDGTSTAHSTQRSERAMASTSEQAAAWIARGFAPIPVPYGAKAPVVPGWQKLRLTAATLDERFNGAPQNVGALLGEPSGGRVCTDLDAPETLALA